MNKIAGLPTKERSEIFEAASGKLGMKPAAIEKDFWICWVLKILFDEPELSRTILFKGGTSLSKVFKVIERFSEDIDLILDWRLVTDENPELKRSRTQQDKFNSQINEATEKYIKENMLTEIQALVAPACSAQASKDEPQIIDIFYPSVFKDDYLRPAIRLEIGPLASWIPHAQYTIKPYASDAYPDLFESADCRVRAIKAERTFWEKATILHQETHRSNSPQPVRYSRHYYDLSRMCHSEIKNRALADLDLLKDVVGFKKKFYSCSWAKYDSAKPGTFKLIPPGHILKGTRQDYEHMADMIFGEYPSFDEILDTLRKLEREINSL